MHLSGARYARAAVFVCGIATLVAQPVHAWTFPPVVGVVRDSAGQPIAHASITVIRMNRVATTNDSGVFRFTGLPPGTHHVVAMRIGYAATHTDIVVPDTGGDVHVTIVMHPAAIQLTNVVVTATPAGADPRDLPQAVTAVAGADLLRHLTSSVAQTLSQEPGVAVRFNGPAAATPIIRGLQGERVLVLQDGDRTGDLSSASPDHALSVDALSANRVEVVRGPASLLYGNQALGGVVNVITNDIPTSIPTHVDGYAATQIESVNPGAAVAAGATIPLSSTIAVVARGGGRHSDAMREGGGTVLQNSFYRNYYGVGGFGFGTNRATGGVVYRGYKFDYGLPTNGSDRVKIDGTRKEVVGRADISMGGTHLTSIRAGGTAQWYSHGEIDMGTGATNTSFDLKTQTLDVLARTDAGRLTGALGASVLFKEYAAAGDEALTPPANSGGVGAFFFQEVALTNSHGDPDARVAKLQAGGRFDSYRIAIQAGTAKFDRFVGQRNFDQFSGSLGLSLPLGQTFLGAISVARAFRAPSVEELSSNAMHEAAGTYDVGNPALKSEINQGIEAIARINTKRTNGQVSAYYNTIKNYITPNIVGDTVIAKAAGADTVPLNRISQSDALLRGLEARFETFVTQRVILGGVGDLVVGEFKSSRVPLPFMPAPRLGGNARFDDGRRSVGAEFTHSFAQKRVPVAVSADDPAGVATGSYDLLSLSASYNVVARGQTSVVTLRVDNALDERYLDATSRLKTFAFNPGRNFALVYRVEF